MTKENKVIFGIERKTCDAGYKHKFIEQTMYGEKTGYKQCTKCDLQVEIK